jgi:general secretion pathway protein C
MVRYLSWLANAALLTLGCFLVANTANAVFAALLTPSPAERAPAPGPEPAVGRSWSDRQEILDRNLFNASLLAPARQEGQEDLDEDLQVTQLPLELLGTVASPNPQLSWAAIEDKETRKHMVLRLHDDVKEGKARVMRIEPKRVVLSENGELRELVLAENTGAPPLPKMSASTRPSRQSMAARRRPSRSRLAARPLQPPPGLEETIRNPAQLFSQARILPKYEDGEMVGVQVSAIQAGSLFEQIGIKDGDVITELNGIKISSPEESATILRELSEAQELAVTIRGPNGPETLNMPTPGR